MSTSHSMCSSLTPLEIRRLSQPFLLTRFKATKKAPRNDSARDASAWRASRSCQRSMKEKDRIVNEIRYIAASLVGAGVDRDALDEALQHPPPFIASHPGTTTAT